MAKELKEDAIFNGEEKSSNDIIVRLRKIQGQVKGIEKMVSGEKEACCKDVLVQVSAVRSAMNKVGGLIIEHYAENCLSIEKQEDKESIKELIDTLMMFTK